MSETLSRACWGRPRPPQAGWTVDRALAAGLCVACMVAAACAAPPREAQTPAEQGLSEDAQATLVMEAVRLRDTRTAFDLDRVEVVTLPGAGFFEASPRAKGGAAAAIRCAVYKQAVYCTAGEILSGLVTGERLGSKPEQLTDDDWVRLCRWALELEMMANPAIARSDLGPELVGAAQVERISLGGVRVTLHFVVGEAGNYPEVPEGLYRVEVRVNHDNSVQVTEQTFRQPH